MTEISRETAADLVEYATVSMAFVVREIVDVEATLATMDEFVVRRVDRPYVKDYDAIDGNRPTDWPLRFDVSEWGFFTAAQAGVRVGGAVVARATPGLDMLEGRRDFAVLWDIRVAPPARRHGVGSALFDAAAAWAASQGCRELKVETQDVNVAACRFYARQGCVLRSIRRGAYSLCPEEHQLLWYKRLRPVDVHPV